MSEPTDTSPHFNPDVTQPAPAIVRPWWAEDLRNIVVHLWQWASAYIALAIGAASTLQLLMPQIENSVSPDTLKIIKAVLAFLIVAREIKDAMRIPTSRADDQPPKGTP